MSRPIFDNNWQKRKILHSNEYQHKAFEEVNELIIKERQGKKIILIDDMELTEFISCSYLGLDQDERVIRASVNNIYKCGVTFPVARTRAITQSFLILEELLNKIFCNTHTILFPSLHLVHLGLLPLLGSGEMPSFPIKDNGPLFILDKQVHASIQINRGLMEQFGDVVLVDFQSLEELGHYFELAASTKRCPIAIADSIGSMGGISPLGPLLEMAEDYNGYIYLDDAHGTSIFGIHGCGYVLEYLNHNLHPRFILTSSLAKGFGAIAGIVVLPTKQDADMVKQFASTYIFGGPPALSIIDSAIASAHIHLSNEIYQLQTKLRENIAYFDSLQKNSINYQTISPIRGILIGDEFRAIDHALALKKRGFAVTTAMYPSVTEGKSMLRIALSAAHTKMEIASLCENLKQILDSSVVSALC